MNTLPGPRDWFCGLTFARRMSADTLNFAREMASEYGDLAYFRVGTMQICILNHPDLIHEAIALKAKSLTKRNRPAQALGQMDGQAISVTEGDAWRHGRKLVQPAFQASRFKTYATGIVRLTEEMLERWPATGTVDLVQEFRLLTLRTMTRTFFGQDVSSQAEMIGGASKTFLDIITRELDRPFDLPDWLPLPSKIRKRRAIRQIREFVENMIEQRRASNAEPDQGDLLSMLLLATDPDNAGKGLSNEQARDQAVGMFRAGQDAMSSMLTWTAAILGQNPDLARRVQHEVHELAPNRALTFADVPRLTYTECVIKEALRLYPPAWLLFSRRATEDIVLTSGKQVYRIPKGTQVFTFPWSLHRDPRFFANPAQLDPDRFLPERRDEIHPHAFIPFGIGPHVCIGNTFSMMHAVLTIATMAQRMQWALSGESQELVVSRTIPLSPLNGLTILPRRIASDVPDTLLQSCTVSL